MFRFSITQWLFSLVLLTWLATACSQSPTTTPILETATTIPPTKEPTEVPTKEIAPTDTAEPPTPTEPASEAYPAPTQNLQAGYPAPTEEALGLTSLAGLPVIDLTNAAEVSLLASVKTFQDARVVWANDGTRFAVFHPFTSGDIRLYSLIAGSLDPVVLSGHSQAVTWVAFSPDGTQLASTGQEGSLRVWDLTTGRQTANLDIKPFLQNASYGDTVTFSPDGKRLAVFAGADSTLLLFNFPLDDTAPFPLAWTEHASPDVSVYPSPDWQTFAWVGRGTLVLMNGDGTFRGEPISHEDFITNVFYSPDSQRLFIQTSQTINDVPQGVVIVYDMRNAQPVQTLTHSDSVVSSTLSPDGVILAASSANIITLWDWAAGAEKLSIPGLPEKAQNLAFSPDGALLDGAFSQGAIQVWDTVTGQVVTSYQTGGEISGTKFVLGGTVLAVMQYDGTVNLLGIAP